MNAVPTNLPQPQGEMNWQVIDMARKEGPLSLYPDGIVARIARGLLGMSVPRGLANDGLEALRRFSVRAWFWDFVPPGEARAFLAAGYSVADAERIVAYVAHHRGFSPSLLLSPA